MTNLTGNTLDNGYVPHEPKTWKYRYAKVKNATKLEHFKGHSANGPVFEVVNIPAGTMVKIVMASRFGDVGITEKLDAEYGYGARVSMDSLYDYQKEMEVA